MVASSLFTLSFPNFSNFYHLAVFICNLFIDGHFWNGHILYDSNVFDVNLLNEIESVCPVYIQWLTTDITQLHSFTLRTGDQTDHIFQLIFFDPNHLEDKIGQITDYLTVYRAFILTSTVDGINLKAPTLMINQLDRRLSLKSLIVQ